MHVVITGGSRGIGAEAVRRFAEKGHRVSFFYCNSETAALALAEESGAKAIRCDLSDAAATAEAFSRLGDIDLLITCAGVAQSGLIQDLSEEDWNKIIAVNLGGVFHAVKGALPSMLRRHEGCIITVSSIWGETGASCEVAYSASKGGVIAMTKALAKELAPSGIRVNSVSPGAVKTDMLACYSEEELEAFRQETPLERLGTPKDIVDAIEYLASADFVTGQILGVNGGYLI